MKLFKQDGFPTELGIHQFKPLQRQIHELLQCKHVQDMSNTELRILNAWLSKMIGDRISDEIVIRKNKK